MFKKTFSILSTIALLSGFLILSNSNFSPKVEAANGKATFTNNLPQKFGSGPLANLFVCINNKMLAGTSLTESASADFSGAAGNYSFTVLDAGITFSENALDLGFTGSNFDVFCQDLSIYDQNQIVGTGDFTLLNDQTTTIALNPNDFDLKISPYLTNFTTQPATATVGTTKITIPDLGSFSFANLCIDGVLTPADNVAGGWPLLPGNYQISSPITNPNVYTDTETYTFCGGQYDDNVPVTVTLAQDTTVNILEDYTKNPEYYYELAIVTINPLPSSSSSSSNVSVTSSPQTYAINTIQDPLSCNTNLTGSGTYSANEWGLEILFENLADSSKNIMSSLSVNGVSSSSPNLKVTITENGKFNFIFDVSRGIGFDPKLIAIPAGNYKITSKISTNSSNPTILATTSYTATVSQDGCILTAAPTKNILVRTGGSNE